MRIPLTVPKVQMALALLLIYFVTFFHLPNITSLVSLILAVSLTVGFDYLFLKIRKIEPFLLSAAIVSGIIIGLLFDPGLPVYELVTVCFLAIVSKNFIRISGKHVFNPAGFGLFLGGAIFGYSVSWWAVSFQQLQINNLSSIFYFLVLISPAYVSFYRMRRYLITLPFLFVYVLSLAIFRQSINLNSIFSLLLDPTVLFFSLVMLPEPMTSPQRRSLQVGYGVLVAILSSLISFVDPLIGGMLLGNLIFFKDGKFLKFR